MPYPSIPAQRGAHRSVHQRDDLAYLQSPRNAGRTNSVTANWILSTFNPRATRGALCGHRRPSSNTPSIPAQRGAHPQNFQQSHHHSLQSPRNAGRTLASSLTSCTATFNPRATRGAQKKSWDRRTQCPSIPAQRGAHGFRVFLRPSDSLQSPRNAGHTMQVSTKSTTRSFNPRATRGAHGVLLNYHEAYPSIPAERGAHRCGFSRTGGASLQSPRNAERTPWRSMWTVLPSFKPRATRGAPWPRTVAPPV
ncbi:hypothetical protein Rfer_4347 (plasmid) [Rhodoferax ferrireducens T118]|uniref:Uncharacterized protein n=1 Tax=Albidiferax ferrireducens (strain ATCC BAA-621 / DSM 15236 / T118) TaxID=338969 RepID=Q21QB2_ALBFT|nr:hypothetical protein Rfer_4347 [Rhodoferax ferrireducens T118]